MCGIGGIVTKTPNFGNQHKSILNEMFPFINARGPDGRGCEVFRNKYGAFIHTRLSIIDLSVDAKQPMVDNSGSVIISFNGEIYNFLELRSNLLKKGHIFKTRSDTEVLIYLFLEYGVEFVNFLRGMFAIAIYDTRLNKLILVRDHFGIKPLYFAYSDEGFLMFCSSQQALIKSRAISNKTPNFGAEVGYYLNGHIPEPWTMVEEVNSLPPGSIMEVEADGRTSVKKYFEMSDFMLSPNIEPQFETLYHALNDTVQCHLISDVGASIFLSSGIDSSVVACHASEFQKSQCFTIGFEKFKSTQLDEVGASKRLADDLSIAHSEKYFSEGEMIEIFEDFVSAMESPTIDGFNTFLLSKFCSSAGAKVCLSGVGADEFFGGYNSFRMVPSFFKCLHPQNKSLKYNIWKFTEEICYNLGKPKLSASLKMSETFLEMFLWKKCVFFPWELESFLEREIVEKGLSKYFSHLAELDTKISEMNEFNKIVFLETQLYLIPQLLRDTDWISMYHGLEVRTPFIDKELFRFISANGFGYRKSDIISGNFAHLFRDRIRSPKKGFNVPINDLITNESEIEDVIPSAGRKTNWSHMLMKLYKQKQLFA